MKAPSPLTIADYEEAIVNLTAVRDQILRDELWHGCAYCGSEDHQPNDCRHNPLAVARRSEDRSEIWRCYHCNATFGRNDLAAARQHFGLSYTALPICVKQALVGAGIAIELTTDENNQPAFTLRLAGQEVATA